MSNNGINEQLLEDIRAVVMEPVASWKKLSDELPKAENGNHVVFYSIKEKKMSILIYIEKDWKGINKNGESINMSNETVIKYFYAWKKLRDCLPSKELLEKLNKTPTNKATFIILIEICLILELMSNYWRI